MEQQAKGALKLENQLCFALYASSKEVIRLYKPLLDPFRLTYTQYITMLVLWERDGITVTELGTRLLLDSGTLTPLLKKLQRVGFIERKRNRDDERTIRISLTKKGRELQEQLADVPHKISCSLGLNDEMTDELKKCLTGLLHNLQNPG